MLQTEFEFVLPKGYVDEQGNLHREGTMRLATAMDEIIPLRDPRVRNNEAYLVVILLSQVITRLGTLSKVPPAIVEKFFAADIAYLQDLYRQINDVDAHHITVICPNCGHEFEEEVPLLGNFKLPLERLHEEVAFVATGLGWGMEEILSLTHQERARWVQQVNRMNNRT